MLRRNFLKIVGIGVGIAVTGESFAASFVSKSKMPNLLFIMTDQQRWDALSLAGNPVVKTPNIDKLASEGVYFERAYTQCAVCGPARASILSGRAVENHGVVTNDHANPGKSEDVFAVKSFDEILHRKGYLSEYYGKWHCPDHRAKIYRNAVEVCHGDSPFGLPLFGRYRKFLDKNLKRRKPGQGEQVSGSYNWIYKMDPIDRRFNLPSDTDIKVVQPDNHGKLLVPAELSPTAYQVSEVMDALDKVGSKPFNITCSITYPHAPMIPTEPYYQMYKPEDMPVPVSIDDDMKNSPYSDANGRKRLPEYRDKEKIKYMISNYYGLIKEIDDWVGKLIKKLEEKGLAENTLVIFTSDHGEMLGSHGMREKNVFYEESAHIPLVIRFPGRIKPNSVVKQPISQIDLFATILDYMQAGDHESDGKSLRPLIEGEDKTDKFIVSEWLWHGDRVPCYMVVSGDWKLFCPHTPESRIVNVLYNLKDDPYEMNNLIGKNPDKLKYAAQVEKMKAMLVSWLVSIGSKNVDGVRKRKMI
ncbi:MAG: sulfatase-like hydrolase/transferase [Phycisphaerae bacterium]|nr:sulfatase-like hydrolase/transferase [Phycisphaerae bacterium]